MEVYVFHKRRPVSFNVSQLWNCELGWFIQVTYWCNSTACDELPVIDVLWGCVYLYDNVFVAMCVLMCWCLTVVVGAWCYETWSGWVHFNNAGGWQQSGRHRQGKTHSMYYVASILHVSTVLFYLTVTFDCQWKHQLLYILSNLSRHVENCML